MFFQFTTSITKARTAINYVLTIRSHVNSSMEDGPSEKDETGDERGAAIDLQDLYFAYPQRPLLQVLKGIDTRVSLLLASSEDPLLIL